MGKNYEVVVIGAGVIGLSVAYQLSKKGIDVAIISPADETQCASRAAGAMIDAFGEIEKLDTPRENEKLDFEVEAQRRYKSWIEEIEDTSGKAVFSQDGIVVIANSGGEHDKSKMQLMRNKMDEYGEKFDEMDPADIVGLLPNYTYRAHEAFFIKDARSVDTEQLLDALEECISRSDKTTSIDATVIDVKENGSKWCVKIDKGDKISANKVIVCAGAHSLRILPDERLKLPKLFFGRGSSVTVVGGPVLPYTLRTPNRALSCGIHMVPRANGKLYLGATNLFGMNFNNLPTGPTVGEIHTLFEAIQNELNTSLRNISIYSMQSGLRPVTQFDRPLCGETNLSGLYVATGTHRTGVCMSPLFAEIITAAVTGDDCTLKNPFDPKHDHDDKPELDLRLGIRSLIATILFPTGKLPYNRMEEIETYITELLRMAAYPETVNGEAKALRKILDDLPLDEQGVLQSYHHIVEEKLPNYGPYPS